MSNTQLLIANFLLKKAECAKSFSFNIIYKYENLTFNQIKKIKIQIQDIAKVI
ncbi:hypothetical protein [Metamycoplasma orale]|uniref:hypothetical protein n=1 Tax=Metamycoplasma orale TaxID=2121 RepID=UPI0013ECF14F|nr:hypothetical protein [Metamycoplasma orale]